jgi:hypothetical protein
MSNTRIIYWNAYLESLDDNTKAVTIPRASLQAICNDWQRDLTQLERHRSHIEYLQTENRRLQRLADSVT